MALGDGTGPIRPGIANSIHRSPLLFGRAPLARVSTVSSAQSAGARCPAHDAVQIVSLHRAVPTGIGPTEDDVSMIWLNNSCTTAQAVTLLETQSPANANIAGIGQIFSGPALTQLFNAPGLPPHGDPRTPDILVTPNVGVTYSGSSKKQAEHGGFAHDDTNVMMLLSSPRIGSATVTSPVETMQVAPTILKALGLDPKALQSVTMEGTEVLPGVFRYER